MPFQFLWDFRDASGLMVCFFLIGLFPDTDTDSRIFNHKNNLMSGNNFPVQYPSKFQREPSYMMPQQPVQQQMMDESMYREQPQMTRNDWPQMVQPQQQQPQIQIIKQQSNSVWPEKLVKPAQGDTKASRKKAPTKNSEYSEEYSDGDESQAEGDDVTTTEAPKKVRKPNNFLWPSFELLFKFSEASQTQES